MVIFNWYEGLSSQNEDWASFADALGSDSPDSVPELSRGWLSSALLPIAPLGGLFLGTLFGPLVGAALKLDTEFTAWQGALIGHFAFPLFLSGCLAIGVFAIGPRFDSGLVGKSRWLLLLSPFLVIPLLFHCVAAVRRWPVQRRIYLDFSKRGAVFGWDGAHQYYGINFRSGTFSNSDLMLLRHFPDLDHVDLSGTSINDLGVPYLISLKKLRLVYLRQTNVTADAINRLQAALPACRIIT
jgi:hypothetical protein